MISDESADKLNGRGLDSVHPLQRNSREDYFGKRIAFAGGIGDGAGTGFVHAWNHAWDEDADGRGPGVAATLAPRRIGHGMAARLSSV
jgi:hypothetical protein